MPIDPTARGDMEADLFRRWYERNRQGWWRRYWRRSDVADDFAIGAITEAVRISSLADDALIRECNNE